MDAMATDVSRFFLCSSAKHRFPACRFRKQRDSTAIIDEGNHLRPLVLGHNEEVLL